MTAPIDRSFTLDDIRFDFEDFLEEHEQNLPEGLDPLYLTYVKNLEHPFRNIKRLPKTLKTLPVNALLYQSWRAMIQIYLILVLLNLPTVISLVYLAKLYNKSLVVGTLLFFIYIGVAASPVYLKNIYSMLNNLIESKRAPWLVEEIKDPFDALYQSGWHKMLLKISLILPLIIEGKMIYLLIKAANVIVSLNYVDIILPIILIILGHLGTSLMLYISILSFYFVWKNTKIYDLLLVRIIKRVKGYTEGHESILTKKNYEVVRVLSDTPGLSIRSLGDIPQQGLISSILVVNAVLFLLIAPFAINGNVANVMASLTPVKKDDTGLTYVILIGILLSSFAAFGAVIMPLFRISRVMVRFKTKALIELDPFLFDEITSLALKRDTEISNETQILYILRSYIYSMKVSPVPPLRLIQLVALSLLYGLRIIPLIIDILHLLNAN